MSTHTPEPWVMRRVDTGGEGTGWPYIAADEADKTVMHWRGMTDKHWQEVSQPEAIANARLMAAAPDLLVALGWLLAEFRSYQDDPDGPGMWPEAKLQAEWAIAKAKGKL